MMGDFTVTGFVQVRPVDLYVTKGYRQNGVVLVGDAFSSSCPAAGTGARKVVVDVERLCNVHIPRWLAWGALGLQTALVAAAVGLWGTPGLVRREIDALRQRVDAERHLAETFQARVAAVSDELAEWKTLHTKIWKAFGPDAAPVETADEDGPRLRDLKRVVNRTSRLLSAPPGAGTL